MKVYVAYYYFSGLQTDGGWLRHCECYQLMGIFSNYERAYESFREKYEQYEECGNTKSYEDYVDNYGVIEELNLDELLYRDEATFY